MKKIHITVIGGGMITHDLILPAIYHLQRTGVVDRIDICALNSTPLQSLAGSKDLLEAFPGQRFNAHPTLDEPAEHHFPGHYREVLAGMPPRQAVIVATPDPFHYEMVMAALEQDQHVLCVKPLVLTYAQAIEIETLALQRGLFVGIEYHKRFDRRALIARRDYGLGHFGVFVMGEAKMIEPYFYRSSNFQNWFTCDRTDPFVYVGCHYVDLVQFITGLKPAAVSVRGIKGRFPNGNTGYMWANGCVTYENGALLSVTDGLGYPDDGAGSNEQCLTMYCEGPGKTGMIKHNDQFRGVTHSYLTGVGCAGSLFNYINPDFFRLVPWEGDGYQPIGYGVESVCASINAMSRIENEVSGMTGDAALVRRQVMIRAIDSRGIIATPANSHTNELVVEAARLSIVNDGRNARIVYADVPYVELT